MSSIKRTLQTCIFKLKNISMSCIERITILSPSFRKLLTYDCAEKDISESAITLTRTPLL